MDTFNNQSTLNNLIISMLLIIISIYGIMISLSDFILSLVLKIKKIKYCNDNLFIARTFSSKSKTMSFTLGTLSMLITFALIALSMANLSKGLFEYSVESEAPYDVDIIDNKNLFEEYKRIISEDYIIENTFEYDIYKKYDSQIRNNFPYGDEEDYDLVTSLSNYNALLNLKGIDNVSLKNNQYLVVINPNAKQFLNSDSSIIEISLSNGDVLKQKEIISKGFWYSLTKSSFYLVVLPDKYVDNLEKVESHLIIDTNEDTRADLKNKIKNRMEVYQSNEGRLNVRGEVIEKNNGVILILSYVCLYIALIFISIVGTIIAIQSLSDSTKYKYRYKVLSELGMRNKSLKSTIRKQLLIMFGLPIIYPIIISFCIIASINKIYQIFLANKYVYLLYFFLGLVIFMIIYIIYFVATYYEFKRNIKEN